MLPGVGLRGGAARTREYFIQALHHGFIEFDLKRAQGAFELLQRARSDNRSGNGRVLQHPGKSDVILGFAQLLAESGKLFQLRAVLLYALRIASAARALDFFKGIASQQSPVQRTPRNHAETQLLRSGEHFEFRQSAGQAVFVLLGNETEEVTALGRGLRNRNLPSGKVAGSDVSDFP